MPARKANKKIDKVQQDSIKRAVIYARVSSKGQEKEGFSIPAQIRLLQDYAAANSIHIEKIFTDVETAKKAGRTDFNEMISFLKASRSC